MSKPFHFRPVPYILLIGALIITITYSWFLLGFKMYKDKEPAATNAPIYYADFEPLHVIATPLEES